MICGLGGCTTKVVAPEYKQIVIATGSPYELGLVDELAKAFQKKHGGVIRCIKTPTGPGLDLGRHGLTHITMGHERAATARFVSEGLAARRTDLMHNFTVVVGPPADPAKIAGLTDIKEVQRRIYEAKTRYLSRGDGGGMDILERTTWKALNIHPEEQPWYQVSKKFMLASLLDAEKFYDFLIGEEGQKIISEFGVKQYGEPIYYATVIKNPK